MSVVGPLGPQKVVNITLARERKIAKSTHYLRLERLWNPAKAKPRTFSHQPPWKAHSLGQASYPLSPNVDAVFLLERLHRIKVKL
jgi:hypothetical protein